MANEEHVKRLKQGVAKWNEWCKTNSEEVDLAGAHLPFADLSDSDLTGASLGRTNLTGANLSNADLTGANLSRANLTEANLSNADLTHVNLSDANLSGAHLHNAEFFRADLGDANLSGAHLHGADFFHANLRGANLAEAELYETAFADVDLTNAIGLETCRHSAPSVIDHRTFENSGSLPLSFLRGVGLPDALIEYLPSLLNQPIQRYSCFISYSSKDKDVADRMHADLQNNGVRCWFAPHDMKIGDKILDATDAAIRVRDKLLLILSEHSIKSDWVEDEVTKAFEEERKRGQIVLFPVRLDDAVMDTNEAWAAKLRARHIGDFRHWKDHDGYKKSFEHVLRHLKRPAENAAASKP